jgi:transposase
LHKIASVLNHSAGLTTPITLVLDNAAYQRCQLVQGLAKQVGIELLFLPSYSPNLNLIERLWKFVKKQALHSRHHTTTPTSIPPSMLASTNSQQRTDPPSTRC